MYSTENGSLIIENSKAGIIDDLKIRGKTKIVDSNNHEVVAGTEGARLLSVGEDVDKIEVSSVNENLYKNDLELGSIDKITGQPNSWKAYARCKDYIQVGGGLTLFANILYDNVLRAIDIYEYDASYTYIKYTTVHKDGLTLQQNTKYIKFASYSGFNQDSDIHKYSNVIISIGKLSNLKHKSNNKPLLYYNSLGELVPIPYLTEFDGIERHVDGKWYYHKISSKVVLNGGENNITLDSVNSDTIRFTIRGILSNANTENKIKIICDKFSVSSYSDNGDYEHIRNSTQNTSDVLIIYISKSKLTTQDVAGFKKWLQSNNVTVVYELAQEEVYEIAPLHLDSYENETMIMCSSGAISPHIEFNIKTSLNDISIVNQELANEIENQRVKLYENLVEKKSEVNSDDSLPVLVNSVKNVNTGRRWASGKASYQSIKATTSFPISCDFVPSILFVKINSVVCTHDGTIVSNAWLSNLESSFTFYNKHYTSFQIRGKVDKVSNKGFTITIDSNYNSMLALVGDFDWYAFE